MGGRGGFVSRLAGGGADSGWGDARKELLMFRGSIAFRVFMKAILFLLGIGVVLPLVTLNQTAMAQEASARSSEVVLDWLLDEGLFEMTPDDLEKKAGARFFLWQDKERTRARFNPDDFNFQLKGSDVGEVLIKFKDGKVAGATVSVKNQVDEKDHITRGAFNDAVKSVKAWLSEASGVKEETRRKEELLSAQSEGAVWRCEKALYVGEWLFLPEKHEDVDGWKWTTPEHGEFVRIRIMPPKVQLGVQLDRIRTAVSRALLAARVKREGKAKAVIEGLPMVDQGRKGCSAVASLERVLRHYGADVDMHQLANAAETYGGKGPESMRMAIQRMSQRLGLRVREITYMKQNQYVILFRNYNLAARQAGKDEVDLQSLKYSGYLDWMKVDPETLRKFRTSGSEFTAFKQAVVDNVNRGIPILWVLQLGLYWEDKIDESYEAKYYAVKRVGSAVDGEEDEAVNEFFRKKEEERKQGIENLRRKGKRPPEYMLGGHMRVIIGYDGATSRIFYTDSWGPGHEMKSMSLEEAWACTLALWTLEPG